MRAGLPHAEKFVQSIAGAAPALGVDLMVIPVRDPAEIDQVIARVGSDSNSALIVNPDAFTVASEAIWYDPAAFRKI